MSKIPSNFTDEDFILYRQLVEQTGVMSHPNVVNNTSRPKLTYKWRQIQGVAKKTVHFCRVWNNMKENHWVPGLLESVYLYDKQWKYGETGSGKYFSTYTYSKTSNEGNLKS